MNFGYLTSRGRRAAKKLATSAMLLTSLCWGLLAPPAGAAELRISGDDVLLTLEEAIEIALEQNLSIQIERYNQRSFDLGIDSAYSIFDTQLQATASTSESTQATADQLQGADVLTFEQQRLDVSASQLTPWGGTLAAQYNNSRQDSNSRFTTLNPRFDINTGFSFTQPLLRNLGELVTKRGILTAKIRSDGNQQFFEQQISNVIQQVEDAYWRVLETREQYNVAQESLDLAKELHRRNKIQVDVGTMAALELVQSEATVATREQEIISARARVGDSADALRRLLNIDDGRAWELGIVPETDPATTTLEIDLAEALETAMTERHEVAQQRLELERLEIERKFADNQLKPRLDFRVAYGLTGLGGDELELVPITDPDGNPIIDPVTGQPQTTSRVVNPGGYSDAFDQITGFDFDNWSVSLTLGYAIQNRAAKANAAQAGVNIDIAKARLADVEQQVRTEVRTAVRGVRSAAQSIVSSRVARELQEKNLEAEQKRYENGMSTSFQITQIQEDLTQARSSEVTAIAGYRRALAEYHRSIGRLLDEAGVVLEDASDPQE